MLDPLELVRQAKNRHYAYKPLSQSREVMGEDYTPSILQGRDITKNPANAAALAAQGVHGANTPQVRPDSPLNPVEPTANGQTLPGFAGGGEVLSKVGKVLSGLLERFKTPVAEEAAHESATLPTDRFSDLMRKYQQKQITLPEMNELIGSLSKSPSEQSILGQPELPKVDVGGGGLSNNQADDLLSGKFAEGGSADSSSLRWIADMSRKLGIPSYADDRARVATGIAKQFYGLDEHGHPKFGGEAWLKSQHGTPPRILDEMTSIPGDIARLANTVFGGKIPANANLSPEDRRAMEHDIPVPKWSDDAAARVTALDQAAEKETGVGQAHSLPEHIEDSAGMLATPFPASKVAGETPMLQRIFEYLSPVRPPTLDRYATDSAILGGAGAGLDKLIDRLSAKAKPRDTSVDPQFEQAAMDSTNQHYAGGGEIVSKLAKLTEEVGQSPAPKKFVMIHGGSDFDTPDPKMLGTGEPGGLRPLGNGLYGYLIRSPEDISSALNYVKLYHKYGGNSPKTHAFGLDLRPGEVGINGKVWDESMLDPLQAGERSEYAAADALPPGPDRSSAYDELIKKYPRKGETPKAFRTEQLPGGPIEISAMDLSRLNRLGKWDASTPDEQVLQDLLSHLK